MRVLITGVEGFVGGHLAQHILNATPNVDIHGTVLQQPPDAVTSMVTCHPIDLRDAEAVQSLIEQVQPDHIYHLAAQAFVPRSFEDPWETLENNIRSQLNIILACLKLDIKPRILIVGSAEVYGIVRPEELPLNEDAPLRPTSPYSVSKIAQDMLGLQYYTSHHLPIMRARAFNHFGPGQNERFVAPAFAMQIAKIEAGLQEAVLSVGDLSAQRDFTDVRDIVRAYQLIVERGTPGDVYNIAYGKACSISHLLDTLLHHTPVDIRIQVDPTRLRPAQIPILVGDSTRLREATGWQPRITFEQTLLDVLNSCRQRIQLEGNDL